MPGGRGGRRTGVPGATYPNRTDLNATRTLPIQAPTGLPYGEHQQLVQSQQQVPIVAPAPVSAAQPVTQPVPPTPPAVLPGALPFNRPTERPNEPVSAGAPMGPGPGPSALGGGGGRISDLIASAAAASGDQDLAFLANQARSRGQ